MSEWTNVKPTAPGWYWFCFYRYNSDTPGIYPVEFDDPDGNRKLWVNDGNESTPWEEHGTLRAVSPVAVFWCKMEMPPPAPPKPETEAESETV